MLRLSLHPKGLAPRIANSPSGARICSRACGTRSKATADATLDGAAARAAALSGAGACRTAGGTRDYAGVVVPLELVTPAGTLAFFSTTTVFGTPVDVTLSELAVEAFFPADAATAAVLRHG